MYTVVKESVRNNKTGKCYLDYPYKFESGGITSPPASRMKLYIFKEEMRRRASFTCTRRHESQKPVNSVKYRDCSPPGNRKRRSTYIAAPKEPLIGDLDIPPTHPKPVKNIRKHRQASPIKKTPNLLFTPIPGSYKSDNIPPPGSRINWNQYHRLAVIHEFLHCLEKTYPSHCSVGIIGHSLERRDIKMVKISNKGAHNFGVWLDAGIHAREWIGPAVNTYIANYIATHFQTLPSYVTNKDWYFLPVANPDGYEYTHTADRMWRKNKAYVNGKCVGVDLNRNFSYGWGGKGSSDIPTHSFYRGTRPFSEPEAVAMKNILGSNEISFKVYITLHSYGEVIIFPFASQDTLCPGYIRLLEGATVMSKAIFKTNGNTYKVGISNDVMYRASGTSNDWSHGAVGIPYCYLIELRSKKARFKVPSEEIEETGNEILNCVFALMEFVDKYPSKKLLAENIIYENVA